MSRKEKTFYNIEMSADLVDITANAMKQQARLRIGDLSSIGMIIMDAYKERVGEEMPQGVVLLLKSKISDLMMLGWGRNLGAKNKIKHDDIISDTLTDASEVLSIQRNYDDGIADNMKVPERKNKNIDLPRIRKRFKSTFVREKQLRVFTE